jgi:hypothetical protein
MHIKKILPIKDQRSTRRVSKKVIFRGSIIVVLLVLGIGARMVIRSFIQWDDDYVVDVERVDKVSVRADISDDAKEKPESSNFDDKKPEVLVRGRLTVTFFKDKGQPFNNGVVTLVQTATGMSMGSRNTGPDGTSGVVVFDEVPAGSYRVIGARKGEEGVRETSKTISIAEGELTSTTIQLAIDTPVTITATVLALNGSPRANTSLTLFRSKGEEGNEEFQVTTNDQGVFIQSGVFPHTWKLLQDGSEIGTIQVAPTGENQTFNVKTNRN